MRDTDDLAKTGRWVDPVEADVRGAVLLQPRDDAAHAVVWGTDEAANLLPRQVLQEPGVARGGRPPERVVERSGTGARDTDEHA
eukprot:gene6943-biopygen8144